MEIRSFADYLRGLDDAGLLQLFSHRPDLISPVPPDMASLAVRASSAPSLARAIDARREMAGPRKRLILRAFLKSWIGHFSRVAQIRSFASGFITDGFPTDSNSGRSLWLSE